MQLIQVYNTYSKSVFYILFSDKGFEEVSPQQWSHMLDKVQLSDPSQLEIAAVVSAKMVSKPTIRTTTTKQQLPLATITPTNETEKIIFSRTPDEKFAYERQINAYKTASKLLTFEGWSEEEKVRMLKKRFVSFKV